MRKKKYNELKEIAYNGILDFYYDQYEDYFKALIYDYLYNEGINKGYPDDEDDINIVFHRSNVDINIYIDDKELMDEYGWYDDVCELCHTHKESLLWSLTHTDNEMRRITKRISNYLDYKEKEQKHE